MAQFSASVIRLESNVWSLGFEVPAEIAREYEGKEYKRVVCSLNGVYEFHCALMPMGSGKYFINVNKEIQTKLGIKEGDRVSASIKPDESKYGLPMPEELEELLGMDAEGNQLFHSLTPGKQRNLIHIVSVPKTAETRIKKALVIVEYLKDVKGKLDFKELNQAFKQANKK